jgi:hypothetical protein
MVCLFVCLLGALYHGSLIRMWGIKERNLFLLFLRARCHQSSHRDHGELSIKCWIFVPGTYKAELSDP